MHLVSCAMPQEPLEDAPRTALLADHTGEDGERWDGFWSSRSDAYYVRRTAAGGGEAWYALVDDECVTSVVDITDTLGAVVAPAPSSGLAMARRPARAEFVVARSPSGRRMLVGSAGRAGR